MFLYTSYLSRLVFCSDLVVVVCIIYGYFMQTRSGKVLPKKNKPVSQSSRLIMANLTKYQVQKMMEDALIKQVSDLQT